MNFFQAGLITIGLVAFTAGCTIGEQERRYRGFFYQTAQPLVPGFRLPDESQYGPAWAIVEGRHWQTRDGSGRTKAEFWTSGEFNGDGALDYAYILVEEATDTRTLFAFVSTPRGYEAQRLDAGFEWGIWLRTRSRRRNAEAARDANPDSSQNALELETINQAIEFFEFDGAETTFEWNATTRSFDRTVNRN